MTGSTRVPRVYFLRIASNMRNTAFAVPFCVLAFISIAQQPSMPNQSTRQNAVPERGDHVMGFSHDATTHHFHLLKDGGEIVVTANDSNDKKSIEQIRAHLNHIVEMFSKGNFNAPMR